VTAVSPECGAAAPFDVQSRQSRRDAARWVPEREGLRKGGGGLVTVAHTRDPVVG
jgi:hypothetical protein